MEIIIGILLAGYILFDSLTNKEDNKSQPNNKAPAQDNNSNSNSNSNSNNNNNSNNKNNKAEFNTKCPHCSKDIIIKLYKR